MKATTPLRCPTSRFAPALMLVMSLSFILALPAVAQNIFTVTNTDDAGPGSLRQAITDANATPNAGAALPDRIEFSIAGSGPHTIQPRSELPSITAPIVIDGTTEPDFAGTPVIILDGSLAGTFFDCLTITAGNCAVRGLIIQFFGGGASGIVLRTNGNNVIAGNHIFNNRVGVFVDGTAGNTIGGTAPEDRNVISGHGSEGILILGSSATGNRVQGNFIGTDAAGTSTVPNGSGIHISDAPNNTVGGTTPAARNLISGNFASGVFIEGTAATGNVVQGNFIGTDITGMIALGNGRDVVFATGGPYLIGGASPELRNIISGNNGDGLDLSAHRDT